MKICKICGVEKELSLMRKNARICKDCRNASLRTGRRVGFPKGGIPWNKGTGETKNGWKAREWIKSVKERDNYICQHCGCNNRLRMQAHHIVPWKDSIELRFELTNGMTLCRSCHKKEDRRIHPEIDAIKGHVVTQETREKIRKALKGRSPPNKGKKGQVAWNKGVPQTEEVKKKLSESLLKYHRDKKSL